MLPVVFNRCLCSIIGHAYPAYKTYKLLKSPALTKDLEENSKLWTVIGFITVIEIFLEPILYWFPFYSELKLLLVLYINLPQLKGYNYIYNQFLLPFLYENEAAVDEYLSKVNLKASEVNNNLTQQGSNIVQNNFSDFLVRGQQSIEQTLGINLPFKSWIGGSGVTPPTPTGSNDSQSNINVPNAPIHKGAKDE